jgi:hypothetical protein
MRAVEYRLRSWAFSCQSALHEIFALFRSLFAADIGDPEADFVLGQLSASCMMSSESALLLIQSARVWDAEMLVRAVVEGTYKFAFMCVRSDEERTLRIDEYYDHLPAINRLKRHDRASTLIQEAEDPNAVQWRPIRDLIIEEPELTVLRAQFPRKQRQLLEQKWAFFPLAQALAGSDLPGADAVARMVYSYGISSHVLHQDGDAVSMIWERQQRSPDREEAITLSHGARELSDLFHLAQYRAMVAYHLKELDPQPILAIGDKYATLAEELRGAYSAWYENEYASGET